MAKRLLRFPKALRLRGRTNWRRLFGEGQSLYESGLKVQYRLSPRQADEAPLRVAFVIPKRLHRRAHQRNRYRRRLREAWRLQYHRLVPHIPADVSLHVALISLHKYESPWPRLREAVERVLVRLAEICAATAQHEP